MDREIVAGFPLLVFSPGLEALHEAEGRVGWIHCADMIVYRVAEGTAAAIKAAAISHPILGEGRIVTASLGLATGSAPGLSVDKLIAAFVPPESAPVARVFLAAAS